ncbi:MAG: type IV pilus twitching motility protein PilT [Clostridia bacterium]|nr:type IV pilus twitching motility protein PilT [Clostridia bacterium]
MGIREILEKAQELGASDVHISVGIPPVFRIDGGLYFQDNWEVISPKASFKIAQSIADSEQWEILQKKGQVDLAYSISGVGRFRVNIFKQRNTIGIAIRTIGRRIKSLDELGLPPVVTNFSKFSSGLVLVTGPTGSGKTTTLAALIDLINTTRSCHIVTLEDPIEYLHGHKKSIVNQREIGTDTPNFAEGLRAVLRQDPDVILVGEMRDLETISTAITAAETGHLVFATLHTRGAPQTVDRIIDVFPPHQQQQIRIQLADTLQAVLTQILLPKKDGKGRVMATEILIANHAVRNLIRDGKTHQLYTVMQSSRKLGMHTLESDLQRLLAEGKITPEVLHRINYIMTGVNKV